MKKQDDLGDSATSMRKDFENVVQRYVREFERREGLEFDHWAGGEIGDTACFGDYYFSFTTIQQVVDLGLPRGLVLEWYWYVLDIHPDAVNLTSYSKGVRVKASPKEV